MDKTEISQGLETLINYEDVIIERVVQLKKAYLDLENTNLDTYKLLNQAITYSESLKSIFSDVLDEIKKSKEGNN